MKTNGMFRLLATFCGGLFFFTLFNVYGTKKNAESELAFSVYKTPKKVGLVVVNKNKKKSVVVVDVDFKKLGLSSTRKAVDARTGKELKFDGNKLKV